jgi:haloalkane dehalogenase
MHYVDEGMGDTILFVHGTPTWSFEWRDSIRHLSRTHRCMAVDHLGFGLSSRPTDFDYTPESHSRVLRELVDRLGLENITLVVHDFGGPIALPLALDAPGLVRRLVVLNSWMWSLNDDSDMRRAGRIAGSRLGRFLYRHVNFSLRVITPKAYADRRKLTPAIHAQYLAPFPDAESRGRVVWPLARAILGSSEYIERVLRFALASARASCRRSGTDHLGNEGPRVESTHAHAMEGHPSVGESGGASRRPLATGGVTERSDRSAPRARVMNAPSGRAASLSHRGLTLVGVRELKPPARVR